MDLPREPPWEISAARMIALPIPASIVDRLGRLHVSAEGLAIDTRKIVPWQDIDEVHTRPAFEVVTTSMIDKASFVLPPFPGADLVTRKAKEALVSILRVALSGSAPSLLFDLPVKVIYRGKREMTPGLLCTAFLALPGVANGLITTARTHGKIIVHHPATTMAAADRAAMALSNRLRKPEEPRRLRNQY